MMLQNMQNHQQPGDAAGPAPRTTKNADERAPPSLFFDEATIAESLMPIIKTGSRVAALLLVGAVLSGCGAVAAPCRVTSAVLKVVPLVGHAAALPTDACASAIDP